MSELMHAAQDANPFAASLCGADGWRTQIASDINCPDCLRRLESGEVETHFGLWEVEQ